MSGHSDGIRKGKFCALRTPKCTDPCTTKNEYQNNCTPKPVKWFKDYFIQGATQVEKKPEAHHLLCVASVTEFIVGKNSIESIIKQTEWCINSKLNMYAMPLWGNTIRYYCNLKAKGAISDPTKVLLDKDEPPKFKNIPQHDYDHNSNLGYKKYEVDVYLKDIARKIEKKKKNHEAAIAELKEELNDLSKFFREELQRRGKRCGGTHKAWSQEIDNKNDWYMPFSMALDGNEEPRPFPARGFNGKVANKIISLVKALKGELA